MTAHSVTCTRCMQVSEPGDWCRPSDLVSPGALFLCVNCGHIMTFSDRLDLRDLTPEEAIQLKRTPMWEGELKPTQNLIRRLGPPAVMFKLEIRKRPA